MLAWTITRQTINENDDDDDDDDVLTRLRFPLVLSINVLDGAGWHYIFIDGVTVKTLQRPVRRVGWKGTSCKIFLGLKK